MMFNEIVVQEAGKQVLDRFRIRSERFMDEYWTADSVETVTAISSAAMRAGARIFNMVCVEDVIMREARVTGLVINWTAVESANLHVDPLAVGADYVIAVDLLPPSMLPEKPTSLLSMWYATVYTAMRATHMEARSADCVITPEVGPFVWTDFSETPKLIQLGREATKEKIAQIRHDLGIDLPPGR